MRAQKNPTAADADEQLWKAGHCYEKAGMAGPAIAMFRQLVARYPKPKRAPEAFLHLARGYDGLAFFKDAAKHYARFADKHPTHIEAPGALYRQVQLLAALGQQRQMRQRVAAFFKRYASSHKRIAARVSWEVTLLSKRKKDAKMWRINLTRYERSHGHVGDVDVTLEALATLAQLHWKRSCRVAMIDGECKRVRMVRRPGRRKKYRRVTYVTRKASEVKLARGYIARALKLWAGGRVLLKIPKGAPLRGARIWKARHFAAQARFMRAELGLEPYLSHALPANLDFGLRHSPRAADTRRRFGAWLKAQLKTAARLQREYVAVVTKIRVKVDGKLRGDAHWSMAAMARTATLFHSFADRLLQTPAPGTLRNFVARDAFKAHLEKIANPLLKKAQVRFKVCLRLSRTLAIYNSWSRLCEREANRLEPSRYPLATELRPAAGKHAALVKPPALHVTLKAYLAKPSQEATNLALAEALLVHDRRGAKAPPALVRTWRRLRFAPRSAGDAALLHLRMVRAKASAALTAAGAAPAVTAFALTARLLSDQSVGRRGARRTARGRAALAAKDLRATMTIRQGLIFLQKKARPRGLCKSPRKPTALDRAAARLRATAALVRLRQGKPGHALHNLTRALACDAGHADALMNRAALAMELRDYHQAQKSYAAVVKLRPKYVDALLGLGVAYRGFASQAPKSPMTAPRWYGLAKTQYERALRVAPKDTRALFNLGILHFEFRSDLKAAKKVFGRYLKKPARLTTAALRKKARKNLKEIAYQQRVLKRLRRLKKRMKPRP